MGLLIGLAAGGSAVTLVLLSSLVAVWGRNYRQFRSKHTMGMLTFAVLLLAENALELYFYVWHPAISAWYNSVRVPTVAVRAILLLTAVELLAVLFLVWVTVD